MTTRTKPIISLAAAAVLGLSVGADACADTSGLKPRVAKQVEACVAEIRRNANYDDAERVVHWVRSLDQETIITLHIDVDTRVYATDGDKPMRDYRVTCVTETTGDVVKFWITSEG